MGKNRDILDYAALGAELIQTSQLSSMRQTLAGLSALQLQKIEAEQREERSRLQEEKVREFVFHSMKLIEGDGDRHAANNPCGTLVVLYGVKACAERFNITTASVRSYEDKEKVDAFHRGLDRLCKECEARLDNTGRETALTCAKYKAEEPELECLIDYENQMSRISDRQKELSQLGHPGMAFKMPLGAAVGIFGLGCVAVLLALQTLSSVAENRYFAGSVFICLAALGLIIGGWAMVPTGKNAALILQEEIEAEKRRLAVSFPSERLRELKTKFGNGGLEYYRKLRDERLSLLKKVMEDAGENSAETSDPERMTGATSSKRMKGST